MHALLHLEAIYIPPPGLLRKGDMKPEKPEETDK